jgi:hypothetical protein
MKKKENIFVRITPQTLITCNKTRNTRDVKVHAPFQASDFQIWVVLNPEGAKERQRLGAGEDPVLLATSRAGRDALLAAANRRWGKA